MGVRTEYDAAIFDRVEMLERLGGDAEMLNDLIDLFLTECPKMLQGVREATEREDPSTIERTGHALKGACLNLSSKQAAAVAEKIEAAGRGDQLGETRALLAQLSDELSLLSEALTAAKN